jgi:hypothetical protein
MSVFNKKIPDGVVNPDRQEVRDKTSESSDKFLRLSIPLTDSNRDTILRILKNTGIDKIGSVTMKNELIISAEISRVRAFTQRLESELEKENVNSSLSSIPPSSSDVPLSA